VLFINANFNAEKHLTLKMDIYRRKSRWKIYLAIMGAVFAIITMVYANYLAGKLAELEKNYVQLYSKALQEVNDLDKLEEEIDLPLSILESFDNIPIIIEGENGNLEGFNFGDQQFIDDQDFLQKEIKELLEGGFVPQKGSQGYSSKFYFKNSKLYDYIKYFPLVQILLLASFIALGYIGFNVTRRSEQNRVWAGMAKETAHQLGTPISAIIAWIEILRERLDGKEEEQEILNELTNDVKRLDLVADRFSKIGSAPKLERTNIYTELVSCQNYMIKRTPKNVQFNFPKKDPELYVMINQHLFDWVVENLLRNSLDAMDGKGKISASIYQEDNYVCIDLSDTGKGIPANKQKTIFKPGYSTKQRGWGLGLSLAKRIIENYHKGKIFVKKSALDEGTTFTIKLPQSD